MPDQNAHDLVWGKTIRPGRYGNEAGAAGVEITPIALRSQIEVLSFGPVKSNLRRSIEDLTGMVLPDAPGAGVIRDGRAVFQHGFDRFFISDRKRNIWPDFHNTIKDTDAALINVCDGRSSLHLRGSQVITTLLKLHAIDFDNQTFRTGTGLATTYHGISVFIQRAGAERFQLYIARSFARDYLQSLIRAGQEYGVDIEPAA